jgi:hypothetical protein
MKPPARSVNTPTKLETTAIPQNGTKRRKRKKNWRINSARTSPTFPTDQFNIEIK